MFDINEELKKLPTCPGVYMHKDRLGTVIYVGKAVNLRNRVRQYFRNSSQHSPKVRSMVSNIAEFDYITCGTEMEALILECNLIKKYMPKYNILLKDDKTYPYIEVTMSEEFPRVIRTREVKRDENRYFGPYSDSTAVWRILKMIDEMYPLKKCSTLHFPENTRPCLNYFIGKCKGICVGKADREEYLEMIRDILGILGGKDAGVIRKLERKMMEASDALKYEEAAKYRDYIRALRSLSERQRATMVREHDIDILIPIRTHRNQIVAQYRVREGKMIGREIIYMNDETESTREELLSAFLKQYYLSTSRIPKEVIVPVHPEEEDLISELLNHIDEMNAKAGTDVPHKTRLYIPERGEKKAILDMTLADSVELARSLDERADRDEERKIGRAHV